MKLLLVDNLNFVCFFLSVKAFAQNSEIRNSIHSSYVYLITCCNGKNWLKPLQEKIYGLTAPAINDKENF